MGKKRWMKEVVSLHSEVRLNNEDQEMDAV